MIPVILDHGLLEHALRVVDRLSGPSRVWVRGDRVVDEIAGTQLGSLASDLQRAPWWRQPRLAPLVALVDLVRRDLVSGQGQFGSGVEPPDDATFTRYRRAKRPLHLLLAELETITDPGSLVMIDPMVDPPLG